MVTWNKFSLLTSHVNNESSFPISTKLIISDYHLVYPHVKIYPITLLYISNVKSSHYLMDDWLSCSLSSFLYRSFPLPAMITRLDFSTEALSISLPISLEGTLLGLSLLLDSQEAARVLLPGNLQKVSLRFSSNLLGWGLPLLPPLVFLLILALISKGGSY